MVARVNVEIRKLAWDRPPESVFAGICDRPGAFFLDSGLSSGGHGRYSIIGFEPFLTFEARAGMIRLRRAAGATEQAGDVLAELRKLIARHACAAPAGLPFAGGAVGYFSYEFGAGLEQVKSSYPEGGDRPEAAFGFHDGLVLFDHVARQVILVANSADGKSPAEIFNRLEHALASSPPSVVAAQNTVTQPPLPASDFSKAEYLKAIALAKNYIAAGDIYQVNLTQRFTAPLPCHPYELYLRLRRRSPAPFASYLNLSSFQIVSSSPERFLRIQDGRAETRPIKGTRPRGKTAADDERLRDELLASGKDRAELLMIVDLERNDLGRVCEPGTIHVDEMFKIETHPTVHHLVANVSGRLRADKDALDCLRAMLPGGSITGAPKVRAMQIIDELEKSRRGVYTGSIGYIGFDGGCDFAIAIRTIVCGDGRASYHVGGGIVADSDPEGEYQETLDKGAAMHASLCESQVMTKPPYLSRTMANGQLIAVDELRVSPIGDGFMFGLGLFETIKVLKGRPVFFEDHHARLVRSAVELGLGIVTPLEELRARCRQVIAANRLVDGNLKLIAFQDEAATGEIILAREGLYPAERYTRGFRLRTLPGQARTGRQFALKTLNYLHAITAKREALADGYDEALFVDANENLLEGATSNLFLVAGGRVHTPPADGRILPGVARGRVLKLLGDRAQEGPLSIRQLQEADEVFVTNALLGVMPVAGVDERVYDVAENPVTRGLMRALTDLAQSMERE